MAVHGLELLWVTRARAAQFDLVFVHGYGGKPETTWHHEESGKTWIKDGEFLSQFKRPLRILSFGYNSDVAANMSAAGVLFHANDLLLCLELAMFKSTGCPVIFVAHGFGGLIVKKAIELCYSTQAYMPSLKSAIAGVVFLGTPHSVTNSEALLRAVKGTIEAFCHEDSPISDEEAREFASVISHTNDVYARNMPKHLKTLSCWEYKPWKPSPQASDAAELAITSNCKKELPNNTDLNMSCDYAELSRFEQPHCSRYSLFAESLVRLVAEIHSDFKSFKPPFPLPPPQFLPVDMQGSIPTPRPRPPPVPRERGSKTRKGKRRKPAPVLLKRKETNTPNLNTRALTEQQDASRREFLSSMKSWSEANHGSDIHIAPGTCEWFKEDGVFKGWLSNLNYGTLFYLASPGQGKSYLAKAISTYIKATKPQDEVMSFYCGENETPSSLWEYFTWHIINNRPHWFSRIPAQYHQRNADSPRMDINALADIWAAFRQACSFCTIYLIIDGLEKSSAALIDFYSSIEQLQHVEVPSRPPQAVGNRPREPTKLKVIFTCRMTNEVSPISTKTSRCIIKIRDTTKDIAAYVDDRLNRFQGTAAVSKLDNVEEIKKTIKDEAKSYWAFAKLAVEEVEASVELKSSLEFDFATRLPVGLARQYDEVLLPIIQSVGNEDHVRTVLNLLASEPQNLPYTMVQLQSILRCLRGDRATVDAKSLKAALRVCQNIFDVPEEAIQFYHPSGRRHLGSYLSAEQQNANMAFVCLKYLLQASFECELPLSWANRRKTRHWLESVAPFYNYAAYHWAVYVAELEDISPQLLHLLQVFLSGRCPQYLTWLHWWAWFRDAPEDWAAFEEPTFMPLIASGCVNLFERFVPAPTGDHSMVASWMHAVPKLLRHGYSGNLQELPFITPDWLSAKTSRGRAVLAVAARSLKPEMVDYMLRWPVDVNARDPDGMTALMVVLDSDLDSYRTEGPEKRDAMCRIVESLLRKGADPNISDCRGDTALHLACSSGSLKAATLLLDYDARINVSNSKGCSPLEEAFRDKRTDMVTELLERGADADVWFIGGDTGLLRSLCVQDMGMFQAFLPFSDVNLASNSINAGVSPIHVASVEAGRIEFLRLLLTRLDLDLDSVSQAAHLGHNSRNALSDTFARRNFAALQMLLEAGASPGYFPQLGMLPLSGAVTRGYIADAELLLAHRAPVNAYTHHHDWHTALAIAAHASDEAMVRLLLDHGADPTTEEGYGTVGPLHAVLESKKPSPGILLQLLQAAIPPDVNFVPKDETHILVNAVIQGNVELVQLLLDHGADTTLWLSPGGKRSPLSEAAERGFVEICGALLDHEPRLIDVQFEEGFAFQSPLATACEFGQSEVVRFLLDKKARVDILSFHYQESILLAACDTAAVDFKTLKMILEAAPEMVNVPSYNGWTPLISACRHGKLEILKLILEAGADIKHQDCFGCTCISNELFTSNGVPPAKMIEMLIQFGLDINAVDTSDGYTVLGVAIREGTIRDVRWLLEHGADPLRCQRGPGLSETWRNALQVVRSGNVHIFEMLLEPQWGLREHVADGDWNGSSGLLAAMPWRNMTRFSAPLAAVCEAMAVETGLDMFTEMMQRPCITGLSPVDYALGRRGVTMEAKPQVDKLIASYMQQILDVPRTFNKHEYLLDQITRLLVVRGGYDGDAVTIMEASSARRTVRWNKDGYYIGASTIAQCCICDETTSEAWVRCRLCGAGACGGCRGKPGTDDFHEHVWLDVKMGSSNEAEMNTVEMQALLERIHGELSSTVTEEAPLQVADSAEDDDHALQSSLQLATLHAFGFLAIRRPLWTPHLALPASTEAIIAQWRRLIRPWRDVVERDELEIEESRERREEEMRYITRGLGRAYMDVDLVKRELVYDGLGKLFEEVVVKEVGEVVFLEERDMIDDDVV